MFPENPLNRIPTAFRTAPSCDWSSVLCLSGFLSSRCVISSSEAFGCNSDRDNRLRLAASPFLVRMWPGCGRPIRTNEKNLQRIPRPAACRTCKDLHKENWLPILAAHLLEQAETRPITRNLDDVETYSEIAIYPRNQGDAPWPTTSR
jgi:hypothetical protein